MQTIIKSDFENMSQEEKEKYLIDLFNGYLERKGKNELYQTNDMIPKIIIDSYYTFENPNFKNIYDSFKLKYIYNENMVEGVKEFEEIMGLIVVYDYILSYINQKDMNIFLISILHQKLYSLVPHPEFGGNFRIEDAYIEGSGVEVTPYKLIPKEIMNLYIPAQELFSRGLKLSTKENTDDLFKYIEDCIKLKCKIIQIHPFKDGNGRTSRAFLNVLFKLVNLPPTYVTPEEKVAYKKAMQNAIVENDFTDICTFYYYKICDSIVELDIKKKLNLDDDILPGGKQI